MKKILSLILCSVVAISAVGCNENSENTSSPSSGTTENNSSAAGNSDTSSSAENSESTSGTVEIFGFPYDIDTTTDLRFNFAPVEPIPDNDKEKIQQVFDNAIEATKKLKNLEAVSFVYGDIYLKYIDFSFLEELPKLKVLDFKGCDLTDGEFIRNLTGLEMLNLSSTHIKDVTLLTNLTNLKEIGFPYIKDFDEEAWLKENLPECKSVFPTLSYKFQNTVDVRLY